MPNAMHSSEPLSHALTLAARAVEAVLGGTALPAALARVAGRAAPATRGAAQDLAYRGLRRLGMTRALLAALVPRAPKPRVHALLVVALALLLDDGEAAAYAPFTVVDQAVAAAAADRHTAAAKGLVNAVLRRFLRERDVLLGTALTSPEARWNYPEWWIARVQRDWPTQWEALLDAGNVRGPLTLRVNCRRARIDDVLAQYRAAGLACEPVGPSAIRLDKAVSVDRLPGFAQGLVSVQDAGAQCAAPLLGVRDGMRVLDACAAPGGKTTHLLELADIDLLALESDATRVGRIDENLRRLDLHATVKVADAGDPDDWWDGRPFDRILADVPCSASGIVRRHPDIRWLRRPDDIDTLVSVQRRLLQSLWRTLAPGGELLYVTCSVFEAENEAQARWFERTSQDAVRLDAPGQLLPAAGGAHDGFFYARFGKR